MKISLLGELIFLFVGKRSNCNHGTLVEPIKFLSGIIGDNRDLEIFAHENLLISICVFNLIKNIDLTISKGIKFNDAIINCNYIVIDKRIII